jgi:hypothetical protein
VVFLLNLSFRNDEHSLLLGVHTLANARARPALALIHLPRQEETDEPTGDENGAGEAHEGMMRRSAALGASDDDDEDDEDGSDIDETLAAADAADAADPKRSKAARRERLQRQAKLREAARRKNRARRESEAAERKAERKAVKSQARAAALAAARQGEDPRHAVAVATAKARPPAHVRARHEVCRLFYILNIVANTLVNR